MAIAVATAYGYSDGDHVLAVWCGDRIAVRRVWGRHSARSGICDRNRNSVLGRDAVGIRVVVAGWVRARDKD